MSTPAALSPCLYHAPGIVHRSRDKRVELLTTLGVQSIDTAQCTANSGLILTKRLAWSGTGHGETSRGYVRN